MSFDKNDFSMQPLRHGGWFDASRSTEFVQDVDIPKGEEPQRLYFTRKANWVLYTRDPDGTEGDWDFISVAPVFVSRWLLSKMDWIKNKGRFGDDIRALFESTEI